MTTTLIRYDVVIHEPSPSIEKHPDLGPVITIEPCASLPSLAVEGIASDGRRCQAITDANVRCPKDAAVALVVDGDVPAHVCGGHYGVHRRGKRSVHLVIEP